MTKLKIMLAWIMTSFLLALIGTVIATYGPIPIGVFFIIAGAVFLIILPLMEENGYIDRAVAEWRNKKR